MVTELWPGHNRLDKETVKWVESVFLDVSYLPMLAKKVLTSYFNIIRNSVLEFSHWSVVLGQKIFRGQFLP